MRQLFFRVRFSLLFFFFCSLICAEPLVIHTVQKGESLFSIAKKYGTTPSQIMALNGIKDARKVKIGQKLKISNRGQIANKSSETIPSPTRPVLTPPERYVVQPGESYSEISRKFGLNESEVRSLNHDVELEAGVVLILQSKVTATNLEKNPPKAQESERERRYLFINAVKDLIDLPRVKKGRWKYIVVHHSATSSGNAAIFDLAHHQRGMENGLAYHFVIGNGKDSKDGEIEVGNRWLKQLHGGHLKSDALNEIALGICFVGNFEEVRPTRRQQAAAIELISYLREKLGKPYPQFKSHREINTMPTSCPGRNFPLSAFHQIFDEE